MRYYLIAGEASGDLHGSNLIRGLRAEDKEAQIRFRGGDLMLAAGGTMIHDYKDGAVMGLTSVIANGGKLLAGLRECKRDIIRWKPDAVILIDYPGFNMRIAKFCHKRGIKVFYYIAPKTWASREGRNRKLKAWVDKLFIVFPFEIPYFKSKGISFVYKGNPLIDAVDGHDYRRRIDGRYIAILAGSRLSEISRMMPVCMEVVDRLSKMPQFADCTFAVAGAPARSEEDYGKHIRGRSNVKLVFGETYDLLKYADAAIINSGTASLEAVLIGTPQVVCWSTNSFSWFVGTRILHILDRIKFISLGNLCIDRLAFRELLQDDFNAAEVSEEVRRLVEDKEYRCKMLSDYAVIRESLGGEGASVAVAKAMIGELSASRRR